MLQVTNMLQALIISKLVFLFGFLKKFFYICCELQGIKSCKGRTVCVHATPHTPANKCAWRRQKFSIMATNQERLTALEEQLDQLIALLAGESTPAKKAGTKKTTTTTKVSSRHECPRLRKLCWCSK